MSRQYRVKNWAKFQHYKDRNPPWIKLHVEILSSEDWVTLDDASKLLMMVCMVVAAKHNGVIKADPAYIKRVAYLSKLPNIKPLIECGFLEPLASASICEQEQAEFRPEKEAEQSRAEKDNSSLARFDEFWSCCPKRVSKGRAQKAWPRAVVAAGGDPERIIAGMRGYAAKVAGKDQQYILHPATWLNDKGWEDDGVSPKPAPDAQTESLAASAWDGRAAPLVAKIGPTVFQAWFGEAKFEPGPPARFVFPKPFQRQWVNSHFRSELEKIYGETRLEVAA